MKIFTLITIATTSLVWATYVNATTQKFMTAQARSDSNECHRVLELAGQDIAFDLNYDQSRAYFKDESCGMEWSSISESKRSSLGAIWRGFGLDLSSDNANASQEHKEWCNDIEYDLENVTYDSNYTTSVNDNAILAWGQCMSAYQNGIQVKHTMSGNSQVLSFMLTNRTTDQDVVISGIKMHTDGLTTGGETAISCELAAGNKVVDVNRDTVQELKPLQGVTMTCERQVLWVQRDGELIDILPSGSITLPNKLEQYMYSFPEKSIKKLTDERANAIEERTKALEDQLEHLTPVGIQTEFYNAHTVDISYREGAFVIFTDTNNSQIQNTTHQGLDVYSDGFVIGNKFTKRPILIDINFAYYRNGSSSQTFLLQVYNKGQWVDISAVGGKTGTHHRDTHLSMSVEYFIDDTTTPAKFRVLLAKSNQAISQTKASVMVSTIKTKK